MSEVTRAYSTFEVKSLNDDRRLITGIATTPAIDLQNDVVEPRGGIFKLPLPLLMGHDHAQPVGNVTEARVTDAGIEVTCQFASVDEPPSLKEELDRAWGLVRARLVRGLSIGFVSLESVPIPGTGGVRHKSWSWIELSAVVVPANQSSNILTVRACDVQARGVVVTPPVTPPMTASSERERTAVDNLAIMVGHQLAAKYRFAATAVALAETMTIVRRLQQASAATSEKNAAAADGIFAAVDAHVRRAVEQSQGDMVVYLTALESRVANIERKR